MNRSLLCPHTSALLAACVVYLACSTTADGHPGEAVIGDGWVRCSPGPWGQLEKKRFTFTVAHDQFPKELLVPKPTRWILPANSSEQVSELLLRVGVPRAETERLVRASTTRIAAGGSVLYPTDELIKNLAPTVRSKLYALLGRSPANASQHNPYSFRPDHFEARLNSTDLSSATKDVIRQLAYRGRALVLFADSDVVLRQTEDPTERRRVIGLLTQFSSYQVRLILDSASDSEQLSRYWGSASHLVSLLSGLSAGNTRVGIVELLSPFAKSKLNTYPERNERRPRVGPDCFWTAANYFHETPDDAFFNPEIVATYIQQQYESVSNPTYGDIALFVDAGSRSPVHAAVFLADDLMFTKNGYHYWTPWTINTRAELLDWYGLHANVSVHYFRHKLTRSSP